MGVSSWLRGALSCCSSVKSPSNDDGTAEKTTGEVADHSESSVLEPPEDTIGAENTIGQVEDDSGSSVWKPPENMTEEALIRLINHLLALLKNLESNSGDATPQQMDSSDTWKEYTAGIPKWLERLASTSRNEEAEENGENTFLPLLVKLLEGIGCLEWAAFAFSMLAFAIDNLDREHENFKYCLDIIQSTVLLLENSKGTWLSYEMTLSSGSDGNDLQKIADLSLRVCVICASCNTNINSSTRSLEELVAYLGTDSLAGSINKIKRETDLLMRRDVSIVEDTPQPYVIPSNVLEITWGNDSRYWNRVFSVTGSWCSQVSYLKAVCWFEVHSKIERVFSPGKYLVSFRIRFDDIRGFKSSPIKLTMSVSTSDDKLIMECERFRYLEGDQSRIVDQAKVATLKSVGDDWLELEVGQFNVESQMSLKVHIGMREVESNLWKSGLIIDCLKVTTAI